MSNLKGQIDLKSVARTEIELKTIDFLAEGNIPTVAAVDYSNNKNMAKLAYKHNTASKVT